MTTDIDVRLSTNILNDPAWPLFCHSQAICSLGPTPPISLVEIAAKTPNANVATGAIVAERFAAKVLDELRSSGFRLWLFLAHGSWQPASRLVRRHGLSRELSLLDESGIGTKSGYYEVESHRNIRFARLVEVYGQTVLNALELVRTNSACFAICSSRDNIATAGNVTELFVKAFPIVKGLPREKIDWLSLALSVCPQGDILIRVTGQFDDREASVDFLLNPDLARAVYRMLQ